MTSEAVIETFFIDRIRKIGGMSIKLVPYTRGLPDRLVIFPTGQIRFVELKTPVGRLSPAQKVWHARAARLGVPVAVLHSPQQIVEWIREEYGRLDPPEPRRGPKPKKCPACGRPPE